MQVRTPDELRAVPLTTKADLVKAGLHGTRALPLEEVCHYGETSGTSGAGANSTWLTAADFERSARAISRRHPDVFAPGHILLNRFPFMAAPAHLIQLIAQQGGGVAIPAGNINWDVPFPRALELAQNTGATVLAGLPLEPIVLGEIARARGLDPARDLQFDTFFLGGAPLPPAMQRRIERTWGASVIELYGSTETMLLGTGCSARALHLEPDLVHCEVLRPDSDEEADVGEEGRLIVTTLGIEGSPLVRLDTGDRVRRLPACECGDARPALVVLGRENDVVELQGRRLHSYDLVEAGAAAADALDSSVFFTIVLPDRLVIRIESEQESGDPHEAARRHLGDVKVEIETTERNALLDVEQISRSPSVYKPVLVSDWRRPGRRILSVNQGMMEWPRPSLPELWRWLVRSLRTSARGRQLARTLRVAKPTGE
ncbi:MAG: phenylacetate--CoA ligase family protein [Deltaproteobacteria bacterium]|nr:phenylacetate--CoA ligase family protein [Deltaproteobacteria bacterium]